MTGDGTDDEAAGDATEVLRSRRLRESEAAASLKRHVEGDFATGSMNAIVFDFCEDSRIRSIISLGSESRMRWLETKSDRSSQSS